MKPVDDLQAKNPHSPVVFLVWIVQTMPYRGDFVLDKRDWIRALLRSRKVLQSGNLCHVNSQVFQNDVASHLLAPSLVSK